MQLFRPRKPRANIEPGRSGSRTQTSFFGLSSTDKPNRPGLGRAQRAAGSQLAATQVQPRVVSGHGRFWCVLAAVAGRYATVFPSNTRRVEHLDFIGHTVEVKKPPRVQMRFWRVALLDSQNSKAAKLLMSTVSQAPSSLMRRRGP